MANALPSSFEPLGGHPIYPFEVQVTGKSSIRQLYLEATSAFIQLPGKNLSNIIYGMVSTTQQSVIADALVVTGGLWNEAMNGIDSTSHGASPSIKQDAVQNIGDGYFQPYSLVSCGSDTIDGTSDHRPIAFPIANGYDFTLWPNLEQIVNASISGLPAIEFPSLNRTELLDLPGSGSDYRLKWVELPLPLFNSTTIGAILLVPQDPGQDKSIQDIYVCNVGAGWGSSSINTSYIVNTMSSTSSHINFDPKKLAQQYISQDSQQNIFSDYYDVVEKDPILFDEPYFPSIPIVVTQDWADYLNPFVPELNTTIIDVLLKTAAQNHSKAEHPWIPIDAALSCLITNGLARTGFTGALQGTPRSVVASDGSTELDGNFWLSGKGDYFIVDPVESKDWLKLQVESTIEGYAYNVRGASPKVAIVFLLVYCVLAIAHILYNGVSGKFSLSYFPRWGFGD